MPVVEAETYDTLVSATGSPANYASGANRKKLRAALDIASSQITSYVFGFEAQNSMMLRRKLNKIDLANVDNAYRPLIEALKDALAACEPLQRKRYGEGAEEETVAFIEDELTVLVECIAELE